MRRSILSAAVTILAALAPLALFAQTPARATASEPDPVLVGAGDISACEGDGALQTAALLDTIPGTVFTLGDNVYPNGSAERFQQCYEPSWGRHKARTRPAVGNHDYLTEGASAYFDYFGAAAGDRTKGWYSYDLGKWHVIVVNSNCSKIQGGCGAGSPQEKWVREDLAAHRVPCTVAMWHHPRFSSSEHGNDPTMGPIFQALYEGGADLALAGHDHTYERFAKQDPQQRPDPDRGIREFVVGVGGRSLYEFPKIQPNSEVRDDKNYGVLKLTLHPTSYDWEFVGVPGSTFSDKGSDKCH
jgi:calcineurin-like phosphoesterase family protein